MFKLNIESSRDIDELHINFSDGTSTIIPKKRQVSKSVDSEVKEKSNPGRKDQVLDTSVDYGPVSQEIVSLPEIETSDRSVSVAPELQNLDI